MLPKVDFSSFQQLCHKITQGEKFQSAVIAASAIGLVILSFQTLWVATMSVFTPQFLFMPLYFVVSCAMIILGIHALEKHESTPHC